MLSALALISLIGWATLLAAGLARLADGLERRRLRRVAAQIRVTEAVHGALGAIVAPTVARHRGLSWTVRMALGPWDLRLTGRLVELAEQALGQEGGPVQVVFTTRPV